MNHKSLPLALTLASDGAFALAGLRPGTYRLFLAAPSSRWLRTSGSVIQGDSGSDWCYGEDGRLENGLLFADVEVESGEELQLDFAPGSEVWPGRLDLEVLIDGKPVTTWGVQLREESSEFWCDLKFGTDSSGHGKTTLFAGRYLVTIEDPLTGWKHTFPDPVVVQASQLTQQVLEVERP